MFDTIIIKEDVISVKDRTEIHEKTAVLFVQLSCSLMKLILPEGDPTGFQRLFDINQPLVFRSAEAQTDILRPEEPIEAQTDILSQPVDNTEAETGVLEAAETSILSQNMIDAPPADPNHNNVKKVGFKIVKKVVLVHTNEFI